MKTTGKKNLKLKKNLKKEKGEKKQTFLTDGFLPAIKTQS